MVPSLSERQKDRNQDENDYLNGCYVGGNPVHIICIFSRQEQGAHEDSEHKQERDNQETQAIGVGQIVHVGQAQFARESIMSVLKGAYRGDPPAAIVAKVQQHVDAQLVAKCAHYTQRSVTTIIWEVAVRMLDDCVQAASPGFAFRGVKVGWQPTVYICLKRVRLGPK